MTGYATIPVQGKKNPISIEKMHKHMLTTANYTPAQKFKDDTSDVLVDEDIKDFDKSVPIVERIKLLLEGYKMLQRITPANNPDAVTVHQLSYDDPAYSAYMLTSSINYLWSTANHFARYKAYMASKGESVTDKKIYDEFVKDVNNDPYAEKAFLREADHLMALKKATGAVIA